jgi:imidazolonepropionase-like amidohydrolase
VNRSAVLAALVLAVGAALVAQRGTDLPRPPIVILGGTLVDGTEAPPRPNEAMLIVDGRIRSIGPRAFTKAPKNATLVQATDRWIVPGLVDAHVHFFQTGGLDARPDIVSLPGASPYPKVVDRIRRMPQVYLRAYVCAGVTSVADFGGPSWIFGLRESRTLDHDSPRIAFAGPLLATHDPPALELEDDEPLWLMKDAADVRAKVERLAAMRPDFVKVWFVHRAGDDIEAQTALVRTAIEAAHARKLRAAVHATTLDTARRAVEAGADILVHGISDRDVDDAFVEAVVARRVIYVPTMLVTSSYRALRLRQVRFEPFEAECAPPETMASFDVLTSLADDVLPRPKTEPPDTLPVQQRNVKRLVAAGAIVAAGTDAGNTATLHGSSLHKELALMVEAGLTPMEALVAATRHGAMVMGREKELGTIAPGMLADVLVLDADPLADIRNTRRIAYVVRGGVVYGR